PAAAEKTPAAARRLAVPKTAAAAADPSSTARRRYPACVNYAPLPHQCNRHLTPGYCAAAPAAPLLPNDSAGILQLAASAPPGRVVVAPAPVRWLTAPVHPAPYKITAAPVPPPPAVIPDRKSTRL